MVAVAPPVSISDAALKRRQKMGRPMRAGFLMAWKRIAVLLLIAAACLLLCVKEPSLLDPGLLRTRPLPMQQFAHPPARVVVAMATVGARISYLQRSLPTILAQSWRLDAVLISVTRASSHTAVQELAAFGPFAAANDSSSPQLGKLSAFRGPSGLLLHFLGPQARNWGPGTKLVAAYLALAGGGLLGRPDDATVIVTLDDDCVYKPGLVEALVTHMPLDGGAVGGYCEALEGADPFVQDIPASYPLLMHGQEPPNSWNGRWHHGVWKPLHRYIYYRYAYRGSIAKCHGWLMGWGGVAYRASSFNESLATFLDGLPEGCFFHDDVWISGYLYLHGVSRYVLLGAPAPTSDDHYFTRQVNLSISSMSQTQVVHQWPCVQHFRGFKP